MHEFHASQGEYLSVEYLYFHSVARTPGQNPNTGTTIAATAAALAQEGQPLEAAWPYSPVPLLPWKPPLIIETIYKATMLPGNFDFEQITTSLNQSKPVVLGLIITDAFFRPDADGVVVFVAGDTERSGHAVLAVGYGPAPSGEGAILIRNSWGDEWGLSGYAWLPRPYVDVHLHETGMLG